MSLATATAGRATLLNNLGSTTELEMSVLAGELRQSAIGSVISACTAFHQRSIL